MAAEIHVGDIGTSFQFTVYDDTGAVVSISTANQLQMAFQRPDGTTFTKIASFITDGTDGGMKYTTLAGDLNVPGVWRAQGIIGFPANSGLWHTDEQKFKVKPNIAG